MLQQSCKKCNSTVSQKLINHNEINSNFFAKSIVVSSPNIRKEDSFILPNCSSKNNIFLGGICGKIYRMEKFDKPIIYLLWVPLEGSFIENYGFRVWIQAKMFAVFVNIFCWFVHQYIFKFVQRILQVFTAVSYRHYF